MTRLDLIRRAIYGRTLNEQRKNMEEEVWSAKRGPAAKDGKDGISRDQTVASRLQALDYPEELTAERHDGGFMSFPSDRRVFLKRAAIAGGVVGAMALGSGLVGEMIGRATANPGDAKGGTVITPTELDIKRIESTLFATEFDNSGPHAGTYADPFASAAIASAIAYTLSSMQNKSGRVELAAVLFNGSAELSVPQIANPTGPQFVNFFTGGGSGLYNPDPRTQRQVSIIGKGMFASMIRLSSSRLLAVPAPSGGNHPSVDITLENFQFVRSVDTYGDGIDLRYAQTARMRNVGVFGSPDSNPWNTGIGITSQGTENEQGLFEDCIVSYHTAGWQFQGDWNLFIGPEAVHCPVAFQLASGFLCVAHRPHAIGSVYCINQTANYQNRFKAYDIWNENPTSGGRAFITAVGAPQPIDSWVEVYGYNQGGTTFTLDDGSGTFLYHMLGSSTIPGGFAIATPTFPTSTTLVQNKTGVTVYIVILTAPTSMTAYSITDVFGSSQSVTAAVTAGQIIPLDPMCKISFTYSGSAGTWKWLAKLA